MDILAKAMANGARVAEAPIQYRQRIGKKKLKPWHGNSIASKMISLAYRLNPTLPLAGALLTAPGAALATWVAYRLFYQGVPHYLLGTLAIILILLGGVSIALLPLATALVRLQAAVARTARRHEPPTDCLPPMPPPQPPPPAPQKPEEPPPTALERAAQGLVVAFTVLLATAAYYLGVGDVNTANKLAQWAYYAEPSSHYSPTRQFAAGLKHFKKGERYIVDVELLKRALRELVEREPAFFRDLMLEALRSDGTAAEAILELITKYPEAKLRLAQAVAETIAVPLNVATKEDLKQLATKQDIKRLEDQMATKEDLKQYATKEDLEHLKKWAEERFVTKEHFDAVVKELKEIMATKEDLKRLEDKMATKEQIESITISVEDSGREMVQYLLEQRGYKCVAERLRLDADYELDIYCNAGMLTAVGEAKVRAGGRDVEKVVERIRELERRRPDKISGRLVPVFYTLVAEPPAVQRAKELKIWLIESRREVVTLEEVLGTDNKQ